MLVKMAPRREDEGIMVFGEETELSSSPPSFTSDHFIKTLSSLSLEHVEENVNPNTSNTNTELQAAKDSLVASLSLISERGERLLARVHETLNSNNASLIVEACKSSLETEFLLMLEEAQLLLNNMDSEGECPITSWRVSLAQLRVDAYLESITTALNCPDSSDFNVALSDVANNIAAELKTKDAAVRISPFNLSSLAFDVTVGAPIHYALEGDLPLNLQVQAIQEIQAKDTMDDKAMPNRACKIEIERCVHEVGSFRAGAGSVGDVLVTIRVSPIGEATGDDPLSETKSDKKWETDMMESCRPVVKEARK